MKVLFRKTRLNLVITSHARLRMVARGLSDDVIVDIIQTGQVKAKDSDNRYWIYKNLEGRRDNFVCLSVVVEDPDLVLVTALVNWRPKV